MSAAVPALVRAVADTNRYAATMIALCHADERTALTSHDRVAVTTLPLERVRPVAEYRLEGRIRGLINASDVVHIHGIWRAHCVVGGRLALQLRKPLVVSAHGMLERWALQRKRWKKLIYSALLERPNLRRAACLRALTRAEAEDYRRFGLDRPVAVIPNGVDPPPVCSSQAFLESFPHLRERRLMLFLSRVHYKKGLHLLCQAWAAVYRRFPDAHLVLAGPDFENTRQSVERLVRELGIPRHVTFTGTLTGDVKWSALAAADVFVLPSYSEGLSMAVLEALAAGLPVIVSRQCNVPEIADEGCGWVIDPNVGQLEHALEDFLRAPSSEKARIAANGKRLVARRYNWNLIGQQMADVYDWVLGAPLPSSVEILTN